MSQSVQQMQTQTQTQTQTQVDFVPYPTLQDTEEHQKEIENIHQEGGMLFVEFGPKNILTKLVGNILKGKPHATVALNPAPGQAGDRQLRQAVVQLRVAGLQLQDIDDLSC